MGRGRAPCCDKSKVNRGPWSPAEDLRLITFIQKHGHGNWRHLPKQSGLSRCGKSCRLRWINYLRPDVKRGNFSSEEEETIIKLHQAFGNKWSKIASYLPGRTDNEIKNVWNTHLKKRTSVKKDGINHHKDEQSKDLSTTTSSSSSSSTSTSFLSSYGNREDNNKGEGVKGQEGVNQRPHDEACNIMEELGKKQDDEPKEALCTSPSNSSYAPNNSTSKRIEVPVPREDDGSLVDHNAAYEVNNSTGTNSDHEDQAMIEIPLESDIDFWDMLDNLDPVENNNESQPHEVEDNSPSPKLGEECEHGEIDQCSQWLKYLENELGLMEATSDGGHHHDHNPSKEYATGEKLRPEIDHGKCYFQMWPSSPQSFWDLTS